MSRRRDESRRAAPVEEQEAKELFAKKSHKDRSQRNDAVKVQRKTE